MYEVRSLYGCMTLSCEIQVCLGLHLRIICAACITVCVCMHVCMYVCMSVCMCLYACMYVCMCMYVYVFVKFIDSFVIESNL